MRRQRREEVGSETVAYAVCTWDSETGDAEVIEHGYEGEVVRRRLITHWPEEQWVGDVTGVTVVYDAAGSEIGRSPIRKQQCSDR